ncbi:hypothetical protein [Limisalsivibrio acetivorans]|uniref:hypothetical protein n=1 Tax=Limisalsivibrio acetivorans TaxID=1304888 RepID=UPI0003B52C03|nr:hypothetical protein [Limisalsivibrio acetivorans]
MSFFLYLCICIAVGMFGINKKFGFWGYFFASLLLTPVMGVILLLASGDKKVRA